MRFFELLAIQHFVLYLFPALITLILIGLALHYTHFRTKDAEERMNRVIHRYPLGIDERNAPFPLFLILVVLGTVIWVFGYILMIGLMEIKI
jgi:hypothetical protein